MIFVTLVLAATDKHGNDVEGGTAVLVNPEHVARIAPVLIVTDPTSGLPIGGVTEITYSHGGKERVRGTAKEVQRTLNP